MSLKAFHVLFIGAAVALAIGCGVWAIGRHRDTGAGEWVLMAALSFVVAVALVAYEIWFLRKTRHVSSW